MAEAPMARAASQCFSSPPRWTILFLFCMVLVAGDGRFLANAVGLGSRLAAKGGLSWVSENGTFAFGFNPADQTDRFQLAIWFAELPGDRTLVWSANRNSPVGKNAILELDASGNLVLIDGAATIWMSNTSGAGVETAVMSETGNLMLLDSTLHLVWQSFSHPSDTLLPNQPLTVSQELTSYSNSPSHGGYYTLKMLQQHTSLSLALTYSMPQSHANAVSSPRNYSYWSGPDISNVTGDVIAVLDPAGSFGMLYGDSSDGAGAVYVYKNDADQEGLSSARNGSVRSDQASKGKILRRLILEANGNIRLYRWDDDYNRSQQWVPEWAAVSNPCEIAGTCGDGICNLDRTKTNATCAPLPGVLSSPSRGNSCRTTEFKVRAMQQTTYHFTTNSVIVNYSDLAMVSKCGEACLSDCECVASVYGLSEETPYCWVLRSLEFGGFEDAGSTLFVKVRNYGSAAGPPLENHGPLRSRRNDKTVLVLPIVLCFSVLIGLLCSLLYYNVHRRRRLRRAMEKYSLVVLGNPIGFTFRDLQCRTSNFSELLGTGGFGSVYKGSLEDGTLIAVKKLDKVLPQGDREFIAEVNTIGSMHHMNLVRLCGYCSEGSQRLLVYEYMKNGSLDRWIFPSNHRRDRHLDWATRFNIAVGTAQGVSYFHEQCRNRIIHCDIKPENILLDDNFCPKVSDFGLAKLMGREHSHVVTMVRGTRGYLAPEWVSNRPITVKADVYSYGMLLLEIIGGRRNLDMSFDAEDFFYPGLAYKEMTNGTALKAADKRLGGAVREEELVRALKVAFWCIQDEVSMRPSMGEVVKMLEGSAGINRPPMPQTVLELIEEGLAQVHRAMNRDFDNPWSSFATTAQPSSHATCSYSSIMSPR